MDNKNTYKTIDLSGIWNVTINQSDRMKVTLPGTLDTNGIGNADSERIESRLTRKHTYEGKAVFERVAAIPKLEDKRIFFEVERARKLNFVVDEMEIYPVHEGSLSTPWCYEVTQFAGREVVFRVVSDNSYKGWPRKSIINSSAATDETQTNWNGLLGYIHLRVENKNFIEAIRVLPHGETLDVELTVQIGRPFNGIVSVKSEALKQQEEMPVAFTEGSHTLQFSNLLLMDNVKRWDEGEGNLYKLMAAGTGMELKEVSFGIRDFGVNENLRLTLNNRVFFLRGEANCGLFPETGHPPMTVEEWKKILAVYASYGVNCMRFHSWCPPNAAFTAADEMGMMMQPELSNWNYSNAFEEDIDYEYYRKELECIIRFMANHPSFVMLTYGNELWTEELGHKRMDELSFMAKQLDNTRMYCNSSNAHYGQRGTDLQSDFYTSSNYKEWMFRAINSPGEGHLNDKYPNSKTDYSEAVQKVHDEGKPVFSFEVGQYEILPEFSEIAEFKGVTRPVNYEIIRERVKERGMLPQWEKWVEATGELSLLGYREEVEAVLRTEKLSGMSLLGLQDFAGQGTALVGMLNSHLKPKPYDFAKPERFRRFFSSQVLLLYLNKYTYYCDETLFAEIKLANYGKKELNQNVSWKILDGDLVLCKGTFEKAVYKNQGLRNVGSIEVFLADLGRTGHFRIVLESGNIKNEYPIWVYPDKCKKMRNIKEGELVGKTGKKVLLSSKLDEDTLAYLQAGGTVFLEPEPTKEHMPCSIGGQFSTDFWSVGTFPEQEGGMGLVIEDNHPVFEQFPTAFHSDWQWWLMSGGRPMILPDNIQPIITVPDSYSRLKHMGLLFEAGILGGRLMVSGMGLHRHTKYPEVCALLDGILTYLQQDVSLQQEISLSELKKLVV